MSEELLQKQLRELDDRFPDGWALKREGEWFQVELNDGAFIQKAGSSSLENALQFALAIPASRRASNDLDEAIKSARLVAEKADRAAASWEECSESYLWKQVVGQCIEALDEDLEPKGAISEAAERYFVGKGRNPRKEIARLAAKRVVSAFTNDWSWRTDQRPEGVDDFIRLYWKTRWTRKNPPNPFDVLRATYLLTVLDMAYIQSSARALVGEYFTIRDSAARFTGKYQVSRAESVSQVLMHALLVESTANDSDADYWAAVAKKMILSSDEFSEGLSDLDTATICLILMDLEANVLIPF